MVVLRVENGVCRPQSVYTMMRSNARVGVKYPGRLSKGVAMCERSLGARAAQDAKCQIT